MKELEKIRIWGKMIPYNTGQKKFNDQVELWDTEMLHERMGEYFQRGEDPNRDPEIRRQVIEQDEIRKWGAHDTYEDDPYILPFFAENPKGTVLIVPGGAYVMKSMEHEGTEVARLLNEEGYHAFVLWYRTYPYRYPVPYLDVQRAIRYIKAHSKEWNADPEKLAVMGFSAGGNAVAGACNILKNLPIVADGYKADEIDWVDATPKVIALNYPALSVAHDPQCLHMLSGKELYENKMEEEAWTRCLELRQYIGPNSPAYFISYGTADTVIQPEEIKAYVKCLQKEGIDVKTLEIEGADHGYGSCVNPRRQAEFLAQGWLQNFTKWFETKMEKMNYEK